MSSIRVSKKQLHRIYKPETYSDQVKPQTNTVNCNCLCQNPMRLLFYLIVAYVIYHVFIKQDTASSAFKAAETVI